MEPVTIIVGNANQLPLEDHSVDLIVTSPPYFGLRAYQDGGVAYEGQVGSEATPQEFLDALWLCAREWWRVLKPEGSLWVNLGDKYAGSNGQSGGTGSASIVHGRGNQGNQPSRYRKGYVPKSDIRRKSLMGLPWRYAIGMIDGNGDPNRAGWILRAEVIWSKPNGLPESVTDRVRRSHEQWFHFVKQERYFSAIDEIRSKECNALPNSVWHVATQPLVVPAELGVDHFAAFPIEFPRRIISGWSPPNATILDPFGGTGTTAAVARALGRKGITNDLSHDYSRLAEWRCHGDGFNKIMHKIHGTKPAKKTAGNGQLNLLAGDIT